MAFQSWNRVFLHGNFPGTGIDLVLEDWYVSLYLSGISSPACVHVELIQNSLE